MRLARANYSPILGGGKGFMFRIEFLVKIIDVHLIQIARSLMTDLG